MPKVLLFYPSFAGAEGVEPLYTDIPLSVVSLAQALHKNRDLYKTIVIDERVDAIPPPETLLSDVSAIGISATTSFQIENGLRFAKTVRRFNPGIPIIWGGWHVSLMPHETIGNPWVDIIVIGQGELILEMVINRLLNKKSLADVPNILYKDADLQAVITERKELKGLQIPATMTDGYKYVRLERYIHSGWGNRRVLGYESSRGCPRKCSFCSISAVYKQRWHGLPWENVFNDLQHLKTRHDIDAVHFFDNNFFVDIKRAFSLSRRMTEENLGIRWDGTITVEQFLKMTPREIALLMKSGFYRVIVGVESGDCQVLSHLNKQTINAQVLELVNRCKEEGLISSLSFMVGFPWDPETDTDNTIRLIEDIKQCNNNAEILLFVYSPYLGTPMYDVAKQYGMTFPDSLEGWANFTYEQINTPWINHSLRRKIDRYLRFLGTKTLVQGERDFYESFSTVE
ncbi:MAG: B12-binding domain-containing radical SAM protein [Defluviitaleaceae bacterium]|nr:B12-binding domain-containing radical SAM protein [Defluviitaleaceae bacterium]